MIAAAVADGSHRVLDQQSVRGRSALAFRDRDAVRSRPSLRAPRRGTCVAGTRRGRPSPAPVAAAPRGPSTATAAPRRRMPAHRMTGRESSSRRTKSSSATRTRYRTCTAATTGPRPTSPRAPSTATVRSPSFVGTSGDGTRVFISTTKRSPRPTPTPSAISTRCTGGITTHLTVGAINGNGAFPAPYSDASSDGTKVFFHTYEPLVAGDTDAAEDVYERSGGTTTLLSSGNINGNGPHVARIPRRVARRHQPRSSRATSPSTTLTPTPWRTSMREPAASRPNSPPGTAQQRHPSRERRTTARRSSSTPTKRRRPTTRTWSGAASTMPSTGRRSVSSA